MKFSRKKYYSSCELLPLWNFFKINSGKEQDVKYLVVLPDRLDYEALIIDSNQQKELLSLWDVVFSEYNELENNHSVNDSMNDRATILYFYSVYLQEQSILKSLLYRTNVGYIRFLRERGYTLGGKTQAEYWQTLYNALKKVEDHLSHIERVKIKMGNLEGDAKKDGNPYDSIMAWIASNDIRVEENITVSRYIKVKEIINNKLKAKRNTNKAMIAQ